MTNQQSYRRTKIVATLGPATDNDSKLEELLASGVNVVRLNFSHGSAQDHIKRAQKYVSLLKNYSATSLLWPTCKARRFVSPVSPRGK